MSSILALCFFIFVCLCSTTKAKEEKHLSSFENDDISIADQINSLQTQLLALENKIKTQNQYIDQLNASLHSYVLTSEAYGVLYYDEDDQTLLPISYRQHPIPFIMLEVISARLPRRDSHYLKARKTSIGGIVPRRPKTHWIHLLVTLSMDGLFQLWDEEQNQLFTYFDQSIVSGIPPTNITEEEEDIKDEDSNDIQKEMNPNFDVFSAITTSMKNGDTWFAVARNDSSFVNIYSIGAYRTKSKVNNHVISEHIIKGDISFEKRISRPDLSNLIPNEMPKKTENAEKTAIPDTNEDKSECMADDFNSCKETAKPMEETDIGLSETMIDSSKAVVNGLILYHKQPKKNVIVSYDDGYILCFNRRGRLLSTTPYLIPNSTTITSMSISLQKLQMIYITKYGFQFLKIPKLKNKGKFCPLPDDILNRNITITSIEFDSVSHTIMYLGTDDGELLIYNTKYMTRKMCKVLDRFYVAADVTLDNYKKHAFEDIQQKNEKSVGIHTRLKEDDGDGIGKEPFSKEYSSNVKGISIESLPGHLLITSAIGLHVYNSSWSKSGKLTTPHLLYIKKFVDDFSFVSGDGIPMDVRLLSSKVLVSSFTDNKQKTIVAYAQSAVNINVSTDDILYNFVVLESFLPAYGPSSGKESIFSKIPLVFGFIVVVVIFVFKTRGGKDGGTSPFSRLSRIFTGKRRSGKQRSSTSDLKRFGTGKQGRQVNMGGMGMGRDSGGFGRGWVGDRRSGRLSANAKYGR